MACFHFYIVRVMEVLRTAGLTRMQGAGEGGSSTLERCVSNLYVYTHTYTCICIYTYIYRYMHIRKYPALGIMRLYLIVLFFAPV